MRSRAPGVNRRVFLERLAFGLAAVPLINACSSDSSSTGPDASGGTGSADAVSGSDWATGGTAAMTGKASYPDPFTSAATSCLLVATTTEGPCTTTSDLAREDVSEGWTGLPVRLALKVVDSSCTPLAGATVKIWHTNPEGSYSGQTPNPSMCLKTSSYSSMNFFRGVGTTDNNGIVYFDTCFPGWYSGRAIHIHFQVKQGNTSTKVSQLFFPENVTQAIFASHPEYSSYGQPNTTFANDNIIGMIASSERSRHIVDVARMTDGAMLASKVVSVV
jgi:protocatechuate 3,4-dioxygenase beta subunit